MMLSRAAALYRACRIEELADPALRVRCHALALRHLHDEAAQARARIALAAMPAALAIRDAGQPQALLTCAMALGAGIGQAATALDRAWREMEQLAWRESRERYAAPASNAAACAALLTAFETSGELRYLRRAETLCRTVTAAGHVERHARCGWALSLLRLARHPVALAHPGSWLVPHAARLFDTVTPALLEETGFVPLAQGLAVATELAARTGSTRRLRRHERLWTRCWHACLALQDGRPDDAAAVLQAIDLLPCHPG